MRTHPVDHAAALRIECPYCYAKPGRNCVSLANAAIPARDIHRIRIHHGRKGRA